MPAVLADAFLDDERFALLSELDSDMVQSFLDDAEADCKRIQIHATMGDRYLRAIKLLAAHRLVMWMNNQAGIAIAGAVSNINVSNGSQSVGFGGGSSSPDDPEALATTVFGREFALIRKQLPLCGFVI